MFIPRMHPFATIRFKSIMRQARGAFPRVGRSTCATAGRVAGKTDRVCSILTYNFLLCITPARQKASRKHVRLEPSARAGMSGTTDGADGTDGRDVALPPTGFPGGASSPCGLRSALTDFAEAMQGKPSEPSARARGDERPVSARFGAGGRRRAWPLPGQARRRRNMPPRIAAGRPPCGLGIDSGGTGGRLACKTGR